jgi:hypothetical protein
MIGQLTIHLSRRRFAARLNSGVGQAMPKQIEFISRLSVLRKNIEHKLYWAY